MKIAILYSSSTHLGLINGLKNLGHSVYSFYYGLGSLPLYSRIIIKLKHNQWEKLEFLFNKKINSIFTEFNKFQIDLLIIIKGHHINEQSTKSLGSLNLKKIQWTTDSLVRFPGQSSLFPLMDKVFVQDGADIQSIQNSTWLPLGFDDTLFAYTEKKTIDILLLGNLQQPYYKSRRESFIKLAKLAKEGYKVGFAGSFIDKELIEIFKTNGVKIFGRLPIKKYAELISKSKICVNIHQDDGSKAINPLFFAIPATGSIQLTDNYEYLQDWLKPGIHYYPTNPETILTDIIPLFALPCLSRDIALDVGKKHSFNARAKQLIEGIV